MRALAEGFCGVEAVACLPQAVPMRHSLGPSASEVEEEGAEYVVEDLGLHQYTLMLLYSMDSPTASFFKSIVPLSVD